MADAPKINPKETLRESYKKLNQAIDNANEAIKKRLHQMLMLQKHLRLQTVYKNNLIR